MPGFEPVGSRKGHEKVPVEQNGVPELVQRGLPSHVLHWPHLGHKVKGLQLLVKSFLLPARVASGCPTAKSVWTGLILSRTADRVYQYRHSIWTPLTVLVCCPQEQHPEAKQELGHVVLHEQFCFHTCRSGAPRRLLSS